MFIVVNNTQQSIHNITQLITIMFNESMILVTNSILLNITHVILIMLSRNDNTHNYS